jgi:hypothetical protein
LRRLRPRVPLVNVAELDRVAGHFLHVFGQCMDLARFCQLIDSTFAVV